MNRVVDGPRITFRTGAVDRRKLGAGSSRFNGRQKSIEHTAGPSIATVVVAHTNHC